jgi:hypothetical protein
MNVVYGTLIVVAFWLVCGLMYWSLCRACARAQHEVELDELWQDEDLELSA